MMGNPFSDKARLAIRARSRAIGRMLRMRAQDIVDQPIPDDMMDLLRAIDAKLAGRPPC